MIGFRSLFVSLFLALAVSSAQAANLFRGETSENREARDLQGPDEGDAKMGMMGMMGMMGDNGKILRQCARRCLRKNPDNTEKAAKCYYKCTKRRGAMVANNGCPRCARSLPPGVCSAYKTLCVTKLCRTEEKCPCNCLPQWGAAKCSAYKNTCIANGGSCKCPEIPARKLQEEGTLSIDCPRYRMLCRKAMMMGGMMMGDMMKGGMMMDGPGPMMGGMMMIDPPML